LLLFSPGEAMLTQIYKFTGIQIPYDLKYEDFILEKGKYDFQILVHHKTQQLHLRILKKGKGICSVLGERLRYESYGRERMKDPNIPDQPTLKIIKHPTEKKVSIIFESGKKTRIYPLVKAVFKMEYE